MSLEIILVDEGVKQYGESEIITDPRRAREIIALSKKDVYFTADNPKYLKEIFGEKSCGYRDRFVDWCLQRPHMEKIESPANMTNEEKKRFLDTGERPINYRELTRRDAVTTVAAAIAGAGELMLGYYGAAVDHNIHEATSAYLAGLVPFSIAVASACSSLINLRAARKKEAERGQKENSQTQASISLIPQTPPQQILYAGPLQHVSGNTFEIPIITAPATNQVQK